MAALIRGTLSEGERGCIKVGKYFALWPAGAVLTDDGVEFEGATVRFGSDVRLGGGYLSVSDAQALADEDGAALIERCATTGDQVAVVQSAETR